MKEQVKASKTTSNFGPTEYEIVHRSGSDLVVRSEESGKDYRRHLTHVKKIPAKASDKSMDVSPDDNIPEIPVNANPPGGSSDEKTGRPKRKINKPNRFSFDA